MKQHTFSFDKHISMITPILTMSVKVMEIKTKIHEKLIHFHVLLVNEWGDSFEAQSTCLQRPAWTISKVEQSRSATGAESQLVNIAFY